MDVDELIEAINSKLDPDELVEVLDLSTEVLSEALRDYIVDNNEKIQEYLEL